jgi:hypothetical protein
MLPQAFDNISKENDFKIHQPSNIFANAVEDLRKNIFNFMNNDKGSSMKLTLA